MDMRLVVGRGAQALLSHRVRVVRVLLTALALIPYLLGWVAGVVVTAATWTAAAVVAGWRDIRRAKGGPGA